MKLKSQAAVTPASARSRSAAGRTASFSSCMKRRRLGRLCTMRSSST